MPPRKNKSEAEDSTSATLDQILEQLKLINSRITTIEDKINNIEHSLDYHAKEVEDLKKDVSCMKMIMPEVQRKVHEQENIILNRSIEIMGIPYDSGEKLGDIVTAVAQKHQIHVDDRNIDLAYRNKSKKSIVVRFIHTHIRNSLLKSAKANRETNLSAKDIGYKSTEKIYLNELLGFECRKLFYLARNFKSKHNFKFAWTTNQNVYLRQKSDTKAILIKSESDLHDLEKSH